MKFTLKNYEETMLPHLECLVQKELDLMSIELSDPNCTNPDRIRALKMIMKVDKEALEWLDTTIATMHKVNTDRHLRKNIEKQFEGVVTNG